MKSDEINKALELMNKYLDKRTLTLDKTKRGMSILASLKLVYLNYAVRDDIKSITFKEYSDNKWFKVTDSRGRVKYF